MSHETPVVGTGMKVQKRNGQVVAFNVTRISNAIGNAFKQFNGLPREAALPAAAAQEAEMVTQKVLSVLKERAAAQNILTVENIQDEVIRQLYENGYKQAASLYSEYRKQHAARRSLFELYTTIKRDGRVVSFKPEKITMAIAKALRAHNGGDWTEPLVQKSQDLTEMVLADIRKQWPEGKAIHIEEIQDLVEKNLMAGGLHDVAKRYILYREDRAKSRQTSAPGLDVSLEWVKSIRLKASGQEEKPFDLNALHFRMETCCAGLEGVSSENILTEAVKNYFNGMTEEQLAMANIMAARTCIEVEPNYSFTAARLLLLKEYRETIGHDVSFEGIKTEYATYFPQFIKKAVDLELLNPDLLGFDLQYLGNKLDAKRDFKFRYMGLQTLYDRYFLHWDGRRLELPQVFWMRVAMGLAKNEGAQKNERAVEFYNVLSTFRFTSSTPTLFNSGTRHSQLSSCFLTTVDDDLFHIFKCVQDDAMLSKWSGGLGNDWTNIRAMGARIKGTNGRSQGIIPFLKVANDTALAVNQGGKRQGAMCAYLEIWHLDVEEFLELRKNTGDERRRTHDMHTANWIPDLFMKRVKNNGDWTLFSPNETPDLHHIFGQAFEKRYEEYEALAREGKMRQFKTMPAVQLWRKMLSMLFETGHPWMTWKDPSNIRSPQDHVGVVHSSNLCTEILLNTSKEETAVCNLGSLNLAAHTTPQGIDHNKLRETIRTAVRMLDNVIDINFYPTVEAKTANQRHRPVGLGLMAFQDALFIQNFSYASQEAVQFADESMEAISYYAILASIELAQERGTYSSYTGSKWDRGMLPIDTLDLLERERGGYLTADRSFKMDWARIREELIKHGIRNSNIMAIAPTATIANIIGVTASVEPIFKNIFVKSNLSGEFTVVNEYLVEDLKKAGLWDQEMLNDLKYFDGSIQEIERIPEEIKRKYATAFEIEYEWMIESASRRQKWIDMGQSLNLYQAKPSGQKVNDMYMLAWEKGLKTTYYLRSMGATRIEKSTLDITDKKYINNIIGGRRQDDPKPQPAATTAAPAAATKPEAAGSKEDCEACQ
ncbi:MAG: ribonucleoside-diphosphate reductase subunit alpha [Candidatus Omnitrophota bacterium]|nr:ribonucleoside-diphosphate reductase subunit alpha [Candidatus Omnitrophota bacterium]MDZ4242619.1 ribonucleoside-diphosphate reductase subunit alpha [Candidatus Omnitrophota bacterium]